MKNSIISLTLFILVSVFIIYYAVNNKYNSESYVVDSAIEFIKGDLSFSNVGVYSYPSICHMGIENGYGIDQELLSNFLSSNEYENGSIQLKILEGKINILTWEDNKHLYETEEVSIKFSSSDKNLVRISRVGFSEDKKEAVVCIESTGMGNLYHLTYIEGIWSVIESIGVWVE